MLDLEKELREWNINERTLAGKYGFKADKTSSSVYISTKPETVNFGGEKFYASFYITERNTFIQLIPSESEKWKDTSQEEAEVRKYKFCKKTVQSMYGKGSEFKDCDLRGTKWRTSSYDISCCMHVYFSEDEPNTEAGGNIWITLWPIRKAMRGFFDRQRKLWYEEFGTRPTAPYSKKDKALFISEPDAEMRAEWEPAFADEDEVIVEGLCDTLTDFYSTYYYRCIMGYLGRALYDFPQVRNRKEAEETAKSALKKGTEIFPDRDLAAIAECRFDGQDGMILFYDQSNDSMFIWDNEKSEAHMLGCSLAELFEMMEPGL